MSELANSPAPPTPVVVVEAALMLVGVRGFYRRAID